MRVVFSAVLAVFLVLGAAGCRNKQELVLLRPGDRPVWQTVDSEVLDERARSLPKAEVVTNKGTFVIELFKEEAPVSVANFIQYVEDGFYDGTIFHRVERGLVIQGGGLDTDLEPKATRDPIANEAGNGLRNLRGTVGMARTAQMDSASAQFFVNLADNHFFNGDGVTGGYAVFGRVYEGMEVVDGIAISEVSTEGRMANVPVDPVVIQSIRMLP